MHWGRSRVWHELKQPVSNALGVSYDAAHVHFGLAIYVVALCIFWRARSPLLLALAATAVLESVNELFDFLDWLCCAKKWSLANMARDMVSTLIWPLLLSMFLRWKMPRA